MSYSPQHYYRGTVPPTGRCVGGTAGLDLSGVFARIEALATELAVAKSQVAALSSLLDSLKSDKQYETLSAKVDTLAADIATVIRQDDLVLVRDLKGNDLFKAVCINKNVDDI